jgi:serine/threonine-protein kinase
VEELAHEESRALRDANAEQGEAMRLRELVGLAEKAAVVAKQAADGAGGAGTPAALRSLYERTGAAQALLDARREQLGEHDQKASTKDQQARDLRRQIDELRAQLSRYAEALEEDLTSGREKVAARTREGLAFEKAFSEVSALLLAHLKAKPEARDLLQDLMVAMHGGSAAQPKAPAGPESRSPAG